MKELICLVVLSVILSGCIKGSNALGDEINDEDTTENAGAPTLLFTTSEIDGLKNAVARSTGSLKTAYENLMIRCENGLSFNSNPYSGNNPTDFFNNVRGPAGLVRNLAVGFALTDDHRYATKAIEIMQAYAEACNAIVYTQDTGTGMLLARSLYPLLCGYDLLRHDDLIPDNTKETIVNWLEGIAPQIRASVAYWEENGYFDAQEFQNHVAAHTMGLLALGYALDDSSLIQFAVDSPENPRDLYELITGSILMEGDVPHHREDPNAAAPEDGEIYDRYRHKTGPVRGLQYAHLTLSLLSISAKMCDNNGLELFSYVAPTGEKLKLPFTYYADFYRLKDACIKTNFYCGETERLGKAGDNPGLFELGYNYYSDSQPLADLIASGAYDRGTAYMDILGYTRFLSVSVDPVR